MSRPGEVNLSVLRDSKPPRPVAHRIVAGALDRALASPRVSPARGGITPLLVPAGLAFAVGLAAVLVFAPFADLFPQHPALAAGTVAEAGLDKSQTFAAAGHEVRVEPGSQVVAGRVERATTELKVARGTAGFKVRHLQTDEIFRVQAGLVTVEAVGTQFEVGIEGACARVAVSEGRVRVKRPGHGPEYLAQGDSRTYCPRPDGSEAPSEEERLMQDAIALVRRGTPADLTRAFDALLTYRQRFPQGAYQEEDLYYLARIAQKLGRADEARSWASRFLERFPQGRRADELRAIAAPK